MPRSAAQSDFIVERPVEVPVLTGPIGEGTAMVELPRATVRTTEASERATRWVMGVTFFMLAILTILCMVGPHIPAGE
jgi:hypothetical protein